MLFKNTIGCNRVGVKEMDMTHGEYTFCCQATLRKAELKKGQTCQKGWDRRDVW